MFVHACDRALSESPQETPLPLGGHKCTGNETKGNRHCHSRGALMQLLATLTLLKNDIDLRLEN